MASSTDPSVRPPSTCDEEFDELLLEAIIPAITVLALYMDDNELVGEESDGRDEIVRDRIAWDSHAEALGYESQFRQYYRMSLGTFERLVNIVSPFLDQDVYQSMRRTSGRQPLSTAGMLQCCLSWLAGGNFHHIRVITGVSKASFYRIVHTVIDAINSAEELRLQFPTTPNQMHASAAAFTTISAHGIMRGCIGAIDGWLCPIRVPRKVECGRVISFFSGHYQRYGLNVQACADHLSRFTAFSVRCPGGMNDSLAFKRWDLSRFLLGIEGPYYVVGDNAYTQSRVVMTPFNRAQTALCPKRDGYNFYLSQLRIRVEMAFGLLVNKWRILKSPLAISLRRTPAMISACMRLHNMCISERTIDGTAPVKAMLREVCQANDDDDISYLESVPGLEQEDGGAARGQGNDPIEEFEHDAVGELMREALVEWIWSNNMHRPARNLVRNRADIAQ